MVKSFRSYLRMILHKINPFHDHYIYHFEEGRMWVECMACGWESRGINVSKRINLWSSDSKSVNN